MTIADIAHLDFELPTDEQLLTDRARELAALATAKPPYDYEADLEARFAKIRSEIVDRPIAIPDPRVSRGWQQLPASFLEPASQPTPTWLSTLMESLIEAVQLPASLFETMMFGCVCTPSRGDLLR